MELEELRVYKKLFELALQVHELALTFPKFEMYELGSQLRRSSNSSPANLAEGFGNRHTNIYLVCISRSKSEIRETRHHLKIAFRKNYLDEKRLNEFLSGYKDCSKMLYGLENSLSEEPKK